MEKGEMLWLASLAIEKNMSYGKLQDSDYMYGKEHSTELVWEYVVEAKEQGMIWFREEYKDFKLYKLKKVLSILYQFVIPSIMMTIQFIVRMKKN